MTRKLNIGSGRKRIEGYENLDLLPSENVDHVHNLEQTPYPFKDNTFDEIKAHAICEHIHNLEGFMNECHRILKPEGVLDIHVPYFNCGTAIRPDHVRYFNYNWEGYFLRDMDCLQSHNKKNWKIIDKSIGYGKLGKVIKFFVGARKTYLISLVLGEVINAIDTKLIPVGKTNDTNNKNERKI